MDTCTLYTPLSSSGAIDPRGTRFAPGASSERSICARTVKLAEALCISYIIFSRFHRSGGGARSASSALRRSAARRALHATGQSRRLYLIHIRPCIIKEYKTQLPRSPTPCVERPDATIPTYDKRDNKKIKIVAHGFTAAQAPRSSLPAVTWPPHRGASAPRTRPLHP